MLFCYDLKLSRIYFLKKMSVYINVLNPPVSVDLIVCRLRKIILYFVTSKSDQLFHYDTSFINKY